MAKYLRYYTEFLSRTGHTIRAEILQESSSAFTPEEIEIGSGDSPLVIEWAETGKLDPIQGSTATLTLNSATDRQLLHLASSIAACDVRLDVYHDGTLWWSGTLDSEGYEEPYTSGRDYDATLTFSDFGVLNRIPWSHTGQESYSVILGACIAATGISYRRERRFISTKHSNGNDLDLAALMLNNDNFYDEESKAMTCFEVLTGILQPFALRIVQRQGTLWIYDLNAAYSRIYPAEVDWNGDDSTLSYDLVYNDAIVRFSPYASDEVVTGKVTVSERNGDGQIIYTSYDRTYGEAVEGFTLRFRSYITAEGATLENGAGFFDIESQYSGSDASGILYSCRPERRALGETYQLFKDPGPCFSEGRPTNAFIGQRIATFPVQYLNAVPYNARSQYRLRITADLLFDVRYNPFEEAGYYNEKTNYKAMIEKCGFVWMPVMVTLRSTPGGTALYHLENSTTALSENALPSGEPQWMAGEGTPGCFFLAYYDHDDRSSKSGVGGWATNRRCIGYYTKDLPSSWAVMPQGEYVPLPPAGGYLEVTLYSGFHIRNRDYVTSIYESVRWVGYKDIAVTLVRKNGLSIDITDQEDIAHVNADTQEDLSLDTILGTLTTTQPTYANGRGTLSYSFAPTGKGLMTMDGLQCDQFTRAGVTDRLEKLLLGTVFSQYATRKVKLSGTTGLIGGFVLSDPPRTAGSFIMAADTQDLLNDTSFVTMTQFGADDYQGIDYE